MLALTLFGPIAITRDGEPVAPFRSQTEMALLVYLAHTGQTHNREAVADLLWEARTTSQSLSNLRTTLSRLRKHVGDELVVTRKTLAVQPGAIDPIDSVRFQQAIESPGTPQTATEAAQLKAALDLYTADFLAGIYLSDAPRFNEWVTIEQERLRLLMVAGLQQLISYALEQQDSPLGINAARQWLALDDLHEAAHARLIHLLALDGQTGAALDQYDNLVAMLDEEFGLEPHDETTDLAARIARGEVVAVATAPAPVVHNLPRDLTPFIGRAAERAALVDLLRDPAHPLVTLTGEGGMGKTRLVIAAAQQIAKSEGALFPEGVWFVPLAGLEWLDSPREAMAGAIGSALGLSFFGERPQSEQLLGLLKDKRCLIVLDNFEHLVETDAPDLVIDLLQADTNLHLVTTSRTRLGLSSEFVLHLDGLSIPSVHLHADNTILTDSLSDYDSVQLFAERATGIGTPFQLANCAADVILICQLVAGVPLAIELAAAWTGRLSCREIADQISSNLDFLATTYRDVPERQRSMRAVFNYSWALLLSDAQQALAQVSVFRGSFGREAAEAVMGEYAAHLDHLIAHSLLQQSEDGRFVIHELLREFASEKLKQNTTSGGGAGLERSAVQQAHARYYLNLVSHVSRQDENRSASFAAAGSDLDNIREAWRWAVSGSNVEGLTVAWRGLWDLFRRRSMFQEGERAFSDALLALHADDSPAAEAETLIAWLRLAKASNLITLTRYDRAIELAQESTALGEAGGDDLLMARGRLIWGTALFRQGQFDQALTQLRLALEAATHPELRQVEPDIRRRLGTTLLEKGLLDEARAEMECALELYRRLHQLAGEANVLADLGWLEQRATNLDTARAHLEGALAIQRSLDNRHGTTMALINLAGVSGMQNGFDETYAYFMEALENLERIDDRYHYSLVNHGLGLHLSRMGQYEKARHYYEESLATDRAIGDVAGVAWTQNNLGLLYNHLGNFETALALHEEALQTARAVQASTSEGLSLSRIGQDLYRLGRYAESLAAYQQAAIIQQELKQEVWLLESRAGEAVTCLALGDTHHALDLVESILPSLTPKALHGARETLRVYWNCYLVLVTVADSRASEVLQRAQGELQAEADSIENRDQRQSFVEKVPEHRAIREASQQNENA